MAAGSPQAPRLASRPTASAEASTEAQSFSFIAAETSASPRDSSTACTGVSEAERTQMPTAAVAVRYVVFAPQRHLTVRHDRGQRRDPVCVIASHRLDTRKSHLAPVIQTKRPPIDNGDYPSLALRLERAAHSLRA